MNLHSIFVLFLFYFTYTDAAATKAPPKNIKVEIFYETLNDAARQFFVYQLTPQFFAEHHDKLTLAVIPYGNTTASQERYICPFGNQQCQTNKMHACFLKTEVEPNPSGIIEDKYASNVVNFMHCFFKNRRAEKNIDSLGERCMPEGHEPDWPTIRTCLFEDDSIMDRFAALTDEIGDDIKEDGLAIRIADGNITDNNKVNFTKEICSRLAVSVLLFNQYFLISYLFISPPVQAVQLSTRWNSSKAAQVVRLLRGNELCRFCLYDKPTGLQLPHY